jgi:sugar/nucleoside kinase (ribokinase family)
VSWENILERVGEDTWHAAWNEARFVAMVNWTMLPHLTELWNKLLDDAKANPPAERKVLFFDLADPEKRTDEDLNEALYTIAKFQEWHDVILGINEKEGQQVVKNLGLTEADESLERNTPAHYDEIRAFAIGIREKLGISVCAVHPTAFAAAASAEDSAVVTGPFTAKPKITTGAGDHFNAGFCTGYLSGGSLAQALQTGVATSGFYVRNAQSPSRTQLSEFLRSL